MPPLLKSDGTILLGAVSSEDCNTASLRTFNASFQCLPWKILKTITIVIAQRLRNSYKQRTRVD